MSADVDVARGVLDVERPCYPATTHRYRRVGRSYILCCVRCGQGKRDIVGAAIRADSALDVERLAEIMAHSGIYDEGLGSRRSAEHVAAEYARLAEAER